MPRTDTRGLYLTIPTDVMDQLVKIAAEDGTSPTRLAEQWVKGAVKDWGTT